MLDDTIPGGVCQPGARLAGVRLRGDLEPRGRPLLVLWDIDQTLIEGGEVSRHAYAAAFRQATGQELTQPWAFDGRTELAAASGVLRDHGLDPGGGLLARFLDLIARELLARAADLAEGGHALPGAPEALAALLRRAGYTNRS